MKRVLLSLGLAVMLMSTIGCHQNQLNRGCGNAQCDRCSRFAGLGQRGAPTKVPRLPRNPQGDQGQMAGGGGTMGAVGYPYYTIRGPRDFFYNQPPSIGP